MEKRLYRSRQNRVIAGVCGGLGDYFNIDPTVVRLVFLLSIIFLGVSAWIYLLALIIMPNEPNLY
jgi:phage shock protein C